MGTDSGKRAHGRYFKSLLLFVAAALIATQAGAALGQIAFGATLTVLRGTVSVVQSNGTAVSPAASGLKLDAGDRVATVGRASALVTFFDGSEVELGADTTIAIQEASGSGSLITIVIENILGNTVHRVVTLKEPGSSYRVVSGESELAVGGTIVGVGTDADGNVTAALVESGGPVTFPNQGHTLHNGETCTATSSGDLVCEQSNGKDVWSSIADGVSSGDGNKPSTTSNTPKNDEKDQKENGQAPTSTQIGTATPTATGTLSATPTKTATPTGTLTPSPTRTATATPTSTLTPTATSTATATDTPTATPTATSTPCGQQGPPPPLLPESDEGASSPRAPSRCVPP